ncbi:UDP-glucose 4-epimerase GalE [Exiguobacterium antarcticum]|uniref:UDP-glucose 4-epimerase n=1 Tax=Exiguobacterium antarcticum TaxID=132920 RepID=A0ABT6R554_9BACL|nr:UDP-glucose 4-epimerase GalE [Exiguobacterium antarcticum]AFS69514.1 UDP-glucose 4-epimerase [Exiguobacterium antarcticum B7]MDI3235406.1 UDP-glucose 4-epimerase GalE [Exiguobacterium antarcticum]
MAVLVVGGAGYIGSHAVYQLVDAGQDVVVIDHLKSGHQEAVHPQARFYEGDIRDRAFLDTVFETETIEQVVHFAAFSLVGESMEHPLVYFDNNVYGTQVLLEAMMAHDVKQIVFSSTAATYGEQEQMPILETAVTNPTNAYGETKLMMEKMMRWCETAYGLNYVALRYFNVAGARSTGEIGEDHTPETHLVPLVLEVANGQRPMISIYGDDYATEDGTCIRDYIHVEDLIDAHVLALDYLKQGNTSDVFNLGSSRGFSVREIIEAARRVTGHAIPEQVVARRAGDPSTLIAGSDKAKTVLGWKPRRTDIDTIIQDAWRWHERRPHGYKTKVR